MDIGPVLINICHKYLSLRYDGVAIMDVCIGDKPNMPNEA